jgi:putative transposase
VVIAAFTINEHYLRRNGPSVSASYEEYESRCKTAGIAPCHYSTFRRMILELDEYEVARRRDGRRAARDRFSPVVKHFPGADRPLAIVQVDHTILDLFVVDEIDRIEVGRPWLTIAIDVFSRMITGFYVSLDPVGTLSVGQCLYRSLIAKEEWLAELKVPGDWPIRGAPATLHFDNAKEFRGKAMARACDELGIIHQFRPVKCPAYGGHVERLMGTISKEMRILPGATPDDVKKLEEYNPGKHAAFTMKELEAYLADFICNKYHREVHSGIGCSPAERAHEGFFGPQGIGIPDDFEDKRMLQLMLMPMSKRTIQRYGIKMDHVTYWSPALHRYFVGDTGKRIQHTVRRDPRDISSIHVWIDQLNDYLTVGYADPTRPRVSVWDLRAATAKTAERQGEMHEQDIFDTYQRLRRREEEAVAKTKVASKERKARINRERRRAHDDLAARKADQPPASTPPAQLPDQPDDNDVLMPFADRRVR